MHFSEFEEAYEDEIPPDNELLCMPISRLEPRAPVLVDASATVAEAVEAASASSMNLT